ncbi:class II fumarate hydratase [Puniceicoccus vermicola]|uniref:Fumarate hydratase class II n=1 Tax=Puniceicoccus vermicola TaxID=388746 RepID=A0A7X1AVC1_9BACT|nr:class II fumarate hydratase [Puniceicoccus vermicola]MBC2600467.1 class II fumarate hydratase [Puniceicoccus vermicola]
MRTEKDSMGEMQVPDEALYGASTQRAVLNFPVSGYRMPDGFIKGLGLVKAACASANEELGRLSQEKAELIRKAADEVMDGGHMEQFPVDVFQTGSGTSSNMNINEVISNLACQYAGKPIGAKEPVHPNDDVNMGQSSNDIVPTVLHVSVALALQETLIPSLEHLAEELEKKSEAFKEVVKIGRTHLMDATPLTLGQEFSGYAAQARKGVERAKKAVGILGELAIGGTAVGTGINCHPDFPGKVARILSEKTGITFREADNHFEAQGGRDDAVEVAGLLTTIAASLTKIGNDIRLLGSGPRSGLGEIALPATQPGSSIMPGKVNPVMSEMLVQSSMYAMGLGNTVAMCGRDGHFELNVTIPLIAYSLHESIKVLGNAAKTFADRCVADIEANTETCDQLVKRSLMLVTALNPHIGYDKASKVAKKAFAENKTLREVVLEEGLLDEQTLDAALDPMSMVHPSA